VSISEPTWQLLTSEFSKQLKGHLGLPLWKVLSDSGSLTDLVKRDCKGAFSVSLLSQTEDYPQLSEAAYLDISQNHKAVIRDVLLCDDAAPLVFAHSVMPLSTLEGAGKVLGDMGSKPLGAELFSNPLIRRGEIQVTALDPQHPLYIRATSQIAEKPSQLWGRRSAFFVGENPLLVCEFFLPTWLPVCPTK
jgi:chorismate--pyruvate lyase